MHRIRPENSFAMIHSQPLTIQLSLRDIEFRRSQKTTIVSGFFWSLEQQGEQIFRKLWRGYFVTLWQANRPTQWWRGRCLQLCCLSPLSLRNLCFSAFILHSTYVQCAIFMLLCSVRVFPSNACRRWATLVGSPQIQKCTAYSSRFW